MPEEKKFVKRTPAKNVKIADISKNMDRIAVLGTVVGKDDAVFSALIDDGSGKINVIMNNEEEYNKVSTSQLIRVIGKVWGEGADVEIQAEIIQDFTGVDAETYNKVFLS